MTMQSKTDGFYWDCDKETPQRPHRSSIVWHLMHVAHLDLQEFHVLRVCTSGLKRNKAAVGWGWISCS